jgi:hypothetical protein
LLSHSMAFFSEIWLGFSFAIGKKYLFGDLLTT